MPIESLKSAPVASKPKKRATEKEAELDWALRPQTFDDYVGQEQTKKNLSILLHAAKKRGDSLDHILLHGPSGLGKTTLAHIIARTFGSGIRVTSGTALEKAGDIGSIVSGLSDGDILFIDEVHRLNKSVEETLYPAMENYQLDIVIGKGAGAKTLQISLPRFTLVAATTRMSLLSNPFRSRFGAQYKLDFYNQSEIEQMLSRSSELLNVSLTKDARILIARSSRYTPRIANHLLRRVRDYAQVHGKHNITEAIATDALALLGVDKLGLENTDRLILKIILQQYQGGPVGLKSIAAAVAEDEETLEDVYEPYLMRLGFLTRTPRGRVATQLAAAHLSDKTIPSQKILL